MLPNFFIKSVFFPNEMFTIEKKILKVKEECHVHFLEWKICATIFVDIGGFFGANSTGHCG